MCIIYTYICVYLNHCCRTKINACMLSCFSCVQLCATLWTAAHQAPLSLGSSQQEYWSGLPCPPQNTECGSFIVSLVAQMVKNPPAMRDTWVQSLGREDPLEKGMAIHSNILAWRIPQTEDPGRLPSQFSSVQLPSHVQLFMTLWTIACQASLSVGFSQQEYWSGLPCPSPGNVPNPVSKLRLLCLLLYRRILYH